MSKAGSSAAALLLAAAMQAHGETALFDAIRQGDTAAIKRLVKTREDANAKDADGTPALMAAALYAGADDVGLLLDRGADPNASNEAGATALMWAVPDTAKMKLLIGRGAEVNSKSTNLGRTPLLIAACYPGSTAALRLLLDKGANLRARDRQGTHALGMALASADVEVVRFLVERGLDVNEPGYALRPLFLARHYAPSVEYLLAKGLKVEKEGLLFAANWHDPKLVAKLIDAGADVNAQGFNRTPLLTAASSESAGPAMLKLLLQRGADPNVAGIDGETPLDWARHRADQARIAVLKEAGGRATDNPRDRSLPAPEGIADARVSLERSAALLLKTAPVVFQKRGCITCHNQSMPAQVAVAARDKGLRVDEELERRNLRQIVGTYRPQGEAAMQGEEPPGNTLTVGYIAMALAAEKHPLDRTTAALSHMTAALQMPDGTWHGNGVSRPPVEESTVSHTAMSVRAMTLYPLPGRRKEWAEKLARTRKWMLAVKPQNAEERAMRLMALQWTGASRTDVEAAAAEIRSQQQAAGGWSQLPQLEADAYATGLSLYALHESGVAPTDPAYQRGVAFLLKTQYADGAWLVRTRSFPVQQQFESGYLFGMHQWISAAGAAWASLAIAYTL